MFYFAGILFNPGKLNDNGQCYSFICLNLNERKLKSFHKQSELQDFSINWKYFTFCNEEILLFDHTKHL